MDVTVRPAVDSDIPALHGLHAAQTGFGGRWFTNPFTGGKEVSFEDLTPAQRWLHGGPWMDPQLLSLHIRRYADAGGAVLVAERAETIVGSIGLWLSGGPLPLGPRLRRPSRVPRREPPGTRGLPGRKPRERVGLRPLEGCVSGLLGTSAGGRFRERRGGPGLDGAAGRGGGGRA